jgi:hypothetical protein
VRKTVVDAARWRLRGVDPRRIAEGVMEAVVGLDQEELAAHAGRTRHGYVEPTEAARRRSRIASPSGPLASMLSCTSPTSPS